MERMKTTVFLVALFILMAAGARLLSQDFLGNLAKVQDYFSRRISSYDRSGGNSDSLAIAPGATAVLAEIPGPGAVHHIWITISAEPFYGRKLILRMYWDGEVAPYFHAQYRQETPCAPGRNYLLLEAEGPG